MMFGNSSQCWMWLSEWHIISTNLTTSLATRVGVSSVQDCTDLYIKYCMDLSHFCHSILAHWTTSLTCLLANLSILLPLTIWSGSASAQYDNCNQLGFPVCRPTVLEWPARWLISAESLSTVRQQLKMHLFMKSFSWLFPGLDFT